MRLTTIPTRDEVPAADTWDLSTLYTGDDRWNADLALYSTMGKAINARRESLSSPDAATADDLLKTLAAWEKAQLLSERLGNYAFLNKSTDEGNAANLDRVGRYLMADSALTVETSWVAPAIQALSEGTVEAWLSDDAEGKFAPYRAFLTKLLRLKPYVLSEKEERLLALFSDSERAPKDAFSALTNVDLDFGTVSTDKGEEQLTQTTWSRFMESKDRAIRKTAYDNFYRAFDRHRNTIAACYAGSVNRDVAHARARGYPSARAMALFPDKVSESVYDNLISTIRSNLAPLHRYYALRKRVLKVSELRHYDVYVPLAPLATRVTPYLEAVSLITDALAPLGGEYVQTLSKGLTGGWVDKYENKGKRSGAFSSGGYEGYPYILMNYKEDVLRDVFTLAHEGGHSMHTLYSARANPIMSYGYTIFEAEVASTFNEELLSRHLMRTTKDPATRAYLLSSRASDIVATLYRQTMFAEFEKRTHELVEGGTPLTAELMRKEYRSILEAYFGPDMVLEAESDLECLRIPHFYNAFYVYKYATGISAALALAERVYEGGDAERRDYFAFLSSGGSRYPIDALKIAGVDMEKSEPIEAACRAFEGVLGQLESALGEL